MPYSPMSHIPPPELKNVKAIAAFEMSARQHRSRMDAITDSVSAAASHPLFVFTHLAAFAAWIGLNVIRRAFDPFPFSLLTLAVSLEAIILSGFLLMAQNRMSRQADRRAHPWRQGPDGLPECQGIVGGWSPVLGSRIPQAHAADGSPAGSHPSFRPHLMQGWSPDFIPKLTEDAVSMELVDQIMPINGNDALRMSRELAQKEGIFVGITAGATFAGALKICESAPAGTKVLCMLPDTGERYLTTPLFADIPADMTEEEVSISRSTPNYRFDVAAPAQHQEWQRHHAAYQRSTHAVLLDEVRAEDGREDELAAA